MDGPKDPCPRVLSLPEAQGGFVGDPASQARDNISIPLRGTGLDRLLEHTVVIFSGTIEQTLDALKGAVTSSFSLDI